MVSLSQPAVIIIPARLHSVRLPNKPLADINGKPMIIHCLERALEEDIAPVIVAAAEPEIVTCVQDAGGKAVLTNPALPSGSDRVYAAIEAIDPNKKYQIILNMQGDLPALPPHYLRQLYSLLIEDETADISTLVNVVDRKTAENPNAVKAISGVHGVGARGYALAFTRAIAPWHDEKGGDASYLHHIGLYGWRRQALERFVSLPPSVLEQRERLEQMRALEAGMRIRLAVVEDCPLGVDTQEELEAARKILLK